MKKVVFMCVLWLLGGCMMSVCAQNRLLERETSKMYKAKIKEYKKTGWKLAGSSKTLEVALLEHYEKMKDPQNVELVGEVSQCKSLNVCKQAAYNNALITYANLAGSTLKGRVVSDLNVDQSDEEGEFDKMYAAYERLVQQEVKGILTESYAIVKERGDSKQYKVFFLVNEEKASLARMRALERAAKETEMAQKYATKIADFVRKGFEQDTIEAPADENEGSNAKTRKDE